MYLSEYVNESFLFPQTADNYNLYQKNHAFLAGLHFPMTEVGKSHNFFVFKH